MPKPVVAIGRCELGSSDAEVEAAVRETVRLAGGVPERVRRARKILVKPNFVGANGKPSDDAVKRYKGRMVSCSEPAVARAVVALLREANPSAEIVFAESIDVSGARTTEDVFRVMGALPLFEDFCVRLVDANVG